ncbi:hypothetical protein CH330_02215 [candidate division WOR-3 bacterium JGI_Cruoil_03_51_56]|uniref:Secretion system C-terminal sorting domain-containing protein n=1 Tax=candidate division WOR-3 bacterium JGI_Cruoil_03_51_56 TaxID=1973747 RepID=A0A235BWA1_UNCW3|nr:MAG: hypothetical protein CH330_02215 [candidate division WOR-3 bacterium JGI_Cruoil_03_51_56]
MASYFIKDSTGLDTKIYIKMLIWVHAANVVGHQVGQLTDLYVGVEQSCSEPVQTRVTAQPNPFCNKTRITVFQGNLRSEPIINIYDKSGRCVRTLQNKSPVIWNGLDQNGHNLPAGVYFIILDAKTRHSCIPVTIVH